MANVGAGRPVEMPPPNYWYEQCATVQSGTAIGVPQASYVPAGMGGTADFYSAAGPTALRDQLVTMFGRIVAGTIP
jgi:hypothetical protein